MSVASDSAGRPLVSYMSARLVAEEKTEYLKFASINIINVII